MTFFHNSTIHKSILLYSLMKLFGTKESPQPEHVKSYTLSSFTNHYNPV